MKSSVKLLKGKFESYEAYLNKISCCYIAVGYLGDGDIGILFRFDNEAPYPMAQPVISLDIKDKDKLIEAAQDAADQNGIFLRVLKFSNCEVMQDIKPSKNEMLN